MSLMRLFGSNTAIAGFAVAGTLSLFGGMGVSIKNYNERVEKAYMDHPSVVRYYDIDWKLRSPVSADTLFDENKMQEYRKIREEKSLIEATPEFTAEKMAYDDVIDGPIDQGYEMLPSKVFGGLMIASALTSLAYALRERKSPPASENVA